MLDGLVGLARGAVGAAGAVVGVRHGTEEPTYTAEPVTSRVEIRHYGPRIAAQTTVAADEVTARSDGFRRLAGYIFGGNQSPGENRDDCSGRAARRRCSR